MTRITSAVGLALLLCTSACTKKQTPPTTPAPAAPAPDAEPAPAEQKLQAPAPTKPAPTSNGRRPGDPCQGGEIK